MKLLERRFYLFKPTFKQPITTAKISMVNRPTLIVGLKDDEGNEWFGEANVFETNWYYEETIDTVKKTIDQWFYQIRGKAITSMRQLVSELEFFNESPAARATIMMALYPSFHRLPTFKIPPVQTINGDFNQRVLQLDNVARIKIKWSKDVLAHVRMVRKVYPDVPISLDANQTLAKNDFKTLEALRKENISYIEEPFQQIEYLDENIQWPPIALDERATSLDAIASLIEKYPISVVVLKPFRLGGIDRTLYMMHQLQSKGVKVVIGGMYETALSRYFTAMLSRSGDFAGDVTPHGYYFEEDLCQTSGQLDKGMLCFEPPKVDRRYLTKY
ncbi:o-succinylbenzoate synthase [Staphylococcus ratti]|uniref:o-succinylbenzoate synthase n=1 Tax=Staphylococcus ratti TaxID=2892440 RepID=A0ABY3PF08_9STAP|nr:o-succinylbenzoate synthase [Staphylococcus ratti]UEX90890.1 o-succinylbenzoate synthase [Staphylococcus ratti]